MDRVRSYRGAWPILKQCLPALALLAIATNAAAALTTQVEDFQSYSIVGATPDSEPSQDWYTYTDTGGYGSFVSPGLANTTQAWFVNATSDTSSSASVMFEVAQNGQVSKIEFYVDGLTIDEDDEGIGSWTRIDILSSQPRRSMVQFYVDCSTNTTATSSCAFHVRLDQANTTGDLLVAAGSQEEFKVEIVPNWITAQFCLEVDDVNDGCHDFYELPSDFAAIKISKVTGSQPMGLTFDEWTTEGIEEGTAQAVTGDAATGILGFANRVGFTGTGSLFIFGFFIFAAVIISVSLGIYAVSGIDRIGVGLSVVGIATAFWLVINEIWPEWIGLVLIITTSAIISITVGKTIGGGDAAGLASLVVSSLGYFIVASSLLALAGYNSSTVEIPTEVIESNNETVEEQGFIGQVAECAFTLLFKCEKTVETRIFKIISDITAWAQAAGRFLFQLLGFQLPIPVWANSMIVFPPGIALAYVGFRLTRGGG